MSIRTRALASIVCAAIVWGVAGPARALFLPCDSGWWATLPEEPMVGVPSDGVFVVRADIEACTDLYDADFDPACRLDDVTIEVTGPEGGVLAGGVEYMKVLGLLVWRAEAPLAPESEHVVFVHIDNGWADRYDLMGSFALVTGSDPAPVMVPPELGWHTATKFNYTPTNCARVSSQFHMVAGTPAIRKRDVWIESRVLENDGTWAPRRFQWGGVALYQDPDSDLDALVSVTHDWFYPADEYCISFEVISIVNGTRAERTDCIPHAHVGVGTVYDYCKPGEATHTHGPSVIPTTDCGQSPLGPEWSDEHLRTAEPLPAAGPDEGPTQVIGEAPYADAGDLGSWWRGSSFDAYPTATADATAGTPGQHMGASTGCELSGRAGTWWACLLGLVCLVGLTRKRKAPPVR